MTDPTPVPQRILVVAAHPDDIDFGVAGTVATWTDAGIEVGYCIATDGDAGGFDPSVSREAMARIRRDEQRRAADVVGVSEVIFLGYPDGRIEPGIELRRDLARVIRQVRPDRMVAPSPDRNWQRIQASHPDHLAVGEATVRAIYPDARNPFAHPELVDAGWEPWVVPELWLMATPEPDVFVDITDVVERKIKALLCHESQLPDPGSLEERIRGWGVAVAGVAGLPEGRLAEGFKRVATA
jgi:LmbE family N-acetylglucosaminyl deacetylase